MELELKHLTAYLPYNLQIKLGDGREMEVIAVRNWIGWCVTYKSENGETNIGIKAVKPILRPLSDITKEIEHKGERFIPVRKLITEPDDNLYPENIDYRVVTNIMGYEKTQKLLEWHFDVFGLIPAGLATERS